MQNKLKINVDSQLRSSLVDYLNNVKIIQKDDYKVAVIDADSIIYAIAANKKQTDEQIEQYGDQTNRTLEDVINEFNNYFINILISSGCIYYVALLTGGSHRYDLYPEYKANRKQLEKPKYLKELTEYCIDNLEFIKLKGYEADDLVNVANNYFKTQKISTVLAHTDKDLNQIEGTHFNYKTNDFYQVNNSEASYSLWTQVIVGDSTDNIKGLKGKGKAFAYKLLLNLDDNESMRNTILDCYCDILGESIGINEFTLNYNLIKLLDSIKDYETFIPIKLEEIVNFEISINI
jgi:5'-3' exonuclease